MREVWGTRLTLGMVKSKLDEHGAAARRELIEIDTDGDPVRCGPFAAEFVRVTHSMPDAVAVALHTDQGTILHTGDYKIDHTPIDGRPHRSREARAARRGRRRPACSPTPRTPSAPGITAVRAGRRGRAQAHHPRRAGPRDRDELLVAHPPPAGRHRRLRGVRPQGRRVGRSMMQEPQHRAQPRLRRRRGGHARQARPTSTTCPTTRSRSSAPARRASRCRRSRAWPTATTARCRSSTGDTVIMSAKPVPGNELAVHDTDERAHAARGARVLHQDNDAGARLGPRLGRGAQDDARARAPARVHAGARRAAHAGRPRRAGRVGRRRPPTASTSATTATCSCSSAARCAARARSRPASCSSTASASAIRRTPCCATAASSRPTAR